MGYDFKVDESICIQEILDGIEITIYLKDGKICKSPEVFDKLYNFENEEFADLQGKLIVGTWLKDQSLIKYDGRFYNKWYVDAIIDMTSGRYLPQKEVFDYCIKHGLLCTDVKYTGKFKSIGHCKQFINKPAYGKHIAGISIRPDGASVDIEIMAFASELYEGLCNKKIIDISKIRGTE